MARLVVDTDVASLSFRGLLPGAMATQLTGHELCVTFVTVGELAKWPAKNRWTRPRRLALAEWVRSFVVLPSSQAVSWQWGRISAGAELRGRRQSENDAWIAACCIAGGLPLVTRNTKDFVDFAEHDGLALVGD